MALLTLGLMYETNKQIRYIGEVAFLKSLGDNDLIFASLIFKT